MKPFLLFVLCILHIVLHPQDTIYKRSGDIIPARVLEINAKEISYKRSDLPDGPLFILGKNDVRKIKYKTGAIDSFSVVNEVVAKPSMLREQAIPYTLGDQIRPSYRKGIYLYRSYHISDRKAMMLAADKNLVWKNKELETEILNAKKNTTRQYATGFGGLAIGAVTLGSIFLYSVNNPYDQGTPAFLFVNGLGLTIASEILSIHFRMKRIKHSNKAISIYNQNL